MNLALVGATGVVGEQILEQLAARSFPLGELRLFASENSVGEFIDFSDDSLPVTALDTNSFIDIDLVIFATPAEVSRQWRPKASAAGVLCLDLSSADRLDEACSLLVAGVNDTEISGTLLSTPASLIVQLSRLLHALPDGVEFLDLLVTAISSASDKGRPGFKELQTQTGELLNGRPIHSKIFPSQLAFNCLPSADSAEEDKLEAELRKVLNLSQPSIRINQMQLPLFFGEGAFVRLEFVNPVELKALKQSLDAADGISVLDIGEFPTPLEALGEEQMLVQLYGSVDEPVRIVDLWYAADNVGCGGAGNAVRLAEMLTARIDG